MQMPTIICSCLKSNNLKFFKIVKTLFFVVTGVLLIYLTIQKVNLNELKQSFIQCNFKRVFQILLVSIGVVVVRAKRWQLLYKSQDIDVKTKQLFHVLNIGYMINFAIPRLGEISRAAILKERFQIQMNRSIASIVFERLSDLIALALILFVAIVSEYLLDEGVLTQLLHQVPFKPMFVWIALFVGIVLVSIIYYFRNIIFRRLNIWLQELIIYLGLLVKLESKTSFLIYTLFIWIGFYLMTMLWIYTFPDSSQLSWYACFEVMLVGVLARTIPIQAGSAGAYHLVVTSAFVYFGLNDTRAFTLAVLIHGFQSFLTILLGIVSYIWLIFQQKNA